MHGASELNVLYQFALKSGDFTSPSLSLLCGSCTISKNGGWDWDGGGGDGIELMTRREN